MLLLLAIAVGGYATTRYLASPLHIENEGFDFTLSKGGSLSSVAYQLAQQGVLDHPRWLIIYARLTGHGKSIKTGDYFFQAGLTVETLINKLERGDVKYYQVTFVEGWTTQQAVDVLLQQERLQKTLTAIDLEKLAKLLLNDEDAGLPALEGRLFPDTYRYHSGVTDMDLLQQSYARMEKVLAEEWQARELDLPYKTPYEALIMASLIEKETGAASERPEIAGVFVRRLRKGMRLQTDPTVIYGLGAAFDGNLRSRHLKDASNRYNTYRHHGLPPTPIALAGREAIRAALHPAKGDTLYFVAKGDGTHYFSRTFKEHQKAVRKYQIEQRRKDYSSAPVTKKSG